MNTKWNNPVRSVCPMVVPSMERMALRKGTDFFSVTRSPRRWQIMLLLGDFGGVL